MSAGMGITRCGDLGTAARLPAHAAESVSTLHIAHWAPTE